MHSKNNTKFNENPDEHKINMKRGIKKNGQDILFSLKEKCAFLIKVDRNRKRANLLPHNPS